MKKDLNTKSEKGAELSSVKSWFKRIVYLIIFLSVLIVGISIYWKYFYTYSDGYRSGILHKFSYKGNIIKTYEGEMIMRSLPDKMNVAVVPEKFNFTVTQEKMANQLDSLQGRMIIVHYKQKNGSLFWRSNSRYLVDSVKLIP